MPKSKKKTKKRLERIRFLDKKGNWIEPKFKKTKKRLERIRFLDKKGNWIEPKFKKTKKKKPIEHNIEVKPTECLFEITQRCNLSCSHCYLDKKKAKDMPLDKCYKVIDKLKEKGITNLAILGGEPTLHQNFNEILNYASDKFKNIVIQTNGTTPTEFIKHPNVVVSVSFESYLADENDAIRGPPQKFIEPATGKIREVGVFELAYRKLSSLENRKILRQTLYYDSDVIGTMVLAEKLNANTVFVPLLPVGNAKDLQSKVPSADDLLDAFKKVKFFNSISKNRHIINHPLYFLFNKELRNKSYNNYLSRGRICPSGNKRIYIDFKGDVSACPFLPNIKFGNIFKNRWEKILKNMREFNNKVLDIKPVGKCKDCKYFYFCRGGCVATYLNPKNRKFFGIQCPLSEEDIKEQTLNIKKEVE